MGGEGVSGPESPFDQAGRIAHLEEQLSEARRRLSLLGRQLTEAERNAATCLEASVGAMRARDAASAELDDFRRLFEMQWKRSQEADARWRAEAPDERALVMPDLGALLEWLMADADKARAERDAFAASLRAERLRVANVLHYLTDVPPDRTTAVVAGDVAAMLCAPAEPVSSEEL